LEDKKKALANVYLSFIFLSATTITNVFVLIWPIPIIMQMFKEYNVYLPRPAQFILWISSSFRENIIILLPLILFGLAGSLIWAIAAGNKRRVASIFIKIAIALLVIIPIAIACSLLPLFQAPITGLGEK